MFIRDAQMALPIRNSLSSFPQAVVQAVPTPCRCLILFTAFLFLLRKLLRSLLFSLFIVIARAPASVVLSFVFPYFCPRSSLLAVDSWLSTARLFLELDSVHIGGGALLRGWFFASSLL